MQTSLVLTVLGADSKGLVKSLSNVINDYSASWQESRMVHLAGKFAGLLQVSLPQDQVEPLKKALSVLEKQGLTIAIEQANSVSEPITQVLTLEVLGQDRPGIIHDITHQLEALHVNIEKLESELRTASMSSESLFYAQLTLGLPDNISPEDVQDSLESMSDQLMVDLNFDVD